MTSFSGHICHWALILCYVPAEPRIEPQVAGYISLYSHFRLSSLSLGGK